MHDSLDAHAPAAGPAAGHLANGARPVRSALRSVVRHETTGRVHLVLVLAGLVGVATGLVVAGFEWLVRDVGFDRIARQPLVVAVAAPAVGLAVAAILVTRASRGDGTTTDAYVIAYHRRGGALPLRRLPAKLLACAATLASGTALGYEGPAILIGGTIGSVAERRFTWRWNQDDAKVLMVAGAAAGVAAVFKAPLTGIVFALEVPYTQDLARRALLPALVAAGASYLTFVALLGTAPVLATGGGSPFDLRDLLGGLLLGVLCGLLARLGAWAIGHAKHLALPRYAKAIGPGVGLALVGLLANALFDVPLTLGSGYGAIEWARVHDRAFGLLVALFLLRFLATWLSVAGGGVGGLFIPLVTQGAVLGQVLQSVVNGPNPAMLPTVGIAAFLGAGYRTPLAGVAFVAEATGQPGFVVPALLAAAASQLTIGRWSFSAYQRTQREPSITPATALHLHEVMSPNPDTVDADLPLDQAVRLMMRTNRRWVPVVSGDRYGGLLAIADVARVSSGQWHEHRVRDVARAAETVDVHIDVAEAARRIRHGEIGALAVTDDGCVVGVVTIRDIANVERLLDRLGPEGADGHP